MSSSCCRDVAGRRPCKDVGTPNSRLLPALPNLRMLLQKLTCPPHRFFFPLATHSVPTVGLVFSSMKCRAGFKGWCAFHRNFLAPRRSRGSHPDWKSLLSFPLFVPRLFCLSPFSPSVLLHSFNLLSVRASSLCPCPLLSLFEPAHFYSSPT